jgi:hypothetical protein
MSFQFHGWSQKTTFLSEGFAVQIDIYDLFKWLESFSPSDIQYIVQNSSLESLTNIWREKELKCK